MRRHDKSNILSIDVIVNFSSQQGKSWPGKGIYSTRMAYINGASHFLYEQIGRVNLREFTNFRLNVPACSRDEGSFLLSGRQLELFFSPATASLRTSAWATAT